MEIIGDQEEAEQYKQVQVDNLNVDEEDNQSESESEKQETEEIIPVKKRRHRKSVQVDPMEDKRKKLLEVHPLAIEVKINMKEGASIKVKISYCVKLEVVTVSSVVEVPNRIQG